MSETRQTSSPYRPLGMYSCLGDALAYARRHGEAAGTHHLLLALAAEGDPVSNQVLVGAGVTYPAACGVLSGRRVPDGPVGGVPGSPTAAAILKTAARPPGIRLFGVARLAARSWTRNLRTMMDVAVRAALAAGRGRPCRADLLMALLSGADWAATGVLAELSASPERLRQTLLERYGWAGPAPAGQFDDARRAAGHVLRVALGQGQCAPPDQADATAWRVGLFWATMDKATQIGADLGQPDTRAEHLVLALLAVYEELAEDEAQFEQDWRACFPLGATLAGSDVTFQRAQQALLSLGSGRDDVTGSAMPPQDDWGMFRTIFKSRHLARAGTEEASHLLGRELDPERFNPIERRLLGALREEDTPANRMLIELGVDRNQLRQVILDAL